MAKDNYLRNVLRTYKLRFNLLQKIPCSQQENKEYQKLLKDGGALPEGVYAYVYSTGETSTTEFYTVYESDLTESEKEEYLIYKKLYLLETINDCIKTIKGCVVFFTTLAIIGLAAYFSYLIIMLNAR